MALCLSVLRETGAKYTQTIVDLLIKFIPPIM